MRLVVEELIGDGKNSSNPIVMPKGKTGSISALLAIGSFSSCHLLFHPKDLSSIACAK